MVAQNLEQEIQQRSTEGYVASPLIIVLGCIIAAHVLLLSSCEDPRTPAERKQEGCKVLLSRYHPALERMFEIEMHAFHSAMPDVDGDWYKAVIKLSVAVQDPLGHPRDPSNVVNDVLSTLAKQPYNDDRRQLEYTLLGMAMPLDARKEFEEYCVVPTPGANP